MPTRVLAGLVCLAALGCGGGTSATPLAAPPADSAAKAAPAKAAAKKPAAGRGLAFDTAAAAGLHPLVRETYQYESASLHDPFKPYVIQLDRGPELADLRLVALLYDPNDASASIATFRDIGNDRRYTVSPGQRIGRISVVGVTGNTVQLRLDDFGTMRDQTYSLRKPEDQKP